MDSSTFFFPFLTFLVGAFISLFGNLVASDLKDEKTIKSFLYYFMPILPFIVFWGNLLFLEKAFIVTNLWSYITAFVLLVLYYLAPLFYKKFIKPRLLIQELGLSADDLEKLVIDFVL